jgi:tripartite ATP-independent transporter DctM subunit
MAEVGLAAWMFPALFALVFLGVPVGFALIVTSAAFGWAFFGDLLGRQMYGRLTELAQGFAFAAVPAFIFMGAVLERAGIAERLFRAMQLWLGPLPGGLAVAAIAMAAVFAATTGIIGAVEIVIGLMAMPVMLAAGYHPRLVAGTITAGGSLGTIIPPSITAVIYGLVAQVPVSDLFAGILAPGALMVGCFVAYILGVALLRPGHAPPAPRAVWAVPLGVKLAASARALLPAAVLIAAVLGAILGGIASPTEAAATGAVGALLLAAFERRLDLRLVGEALRRTTAVTAMIMTIVFGGTLFSAVFYLHGGGQLVAGLAGDGALSPLALVLLLLAIVFALGFVLDWATIVLICVPIFNPLLAAQGIDKLWFGVAMLVTIQTSYLTPPMAPAIFYLQSIAPPELRWRDIALGQIPFVAAQLVTLALVLAFPALATWLPEVLRRF